MKKKISLILSLVIALVFLTATINVNAQTNSYSRTEIVEMLVNMLEKLAPNELNQSECNWVRCSEFISVEIGDSFNVGQREYTLNAIDGSRSNAELTLQVDEAHDHHSEQFETIVYEGDMVNAGTSSHYFFVERVDGKVAHIELLKRSACAGGFGGEFDKKVGCYSETNFK